MSSTTIQKNHKFLYAVFLTLLIVPVTFYMIRRLGSVFGTSPTAPLPYRLKLIRALRGETVNESIQNLAAFDDTLWALGKMATEPLAPQKRYGYSRVFIPGLSRVRKVIQEAQAERSAVVAALEGVFKRHIEPDFAPLEEEKNQLVAQTSGGVTLNEPDAYWTAIVSAPSAAYLLCELRSHESLPMLSEGLRSRHVVPISKLFLFFCVHELIESYPYTTLTPRGRALREEFLASSKLPRSELVEVSAWDALYEETDFRIVNLKQSVGQDEIGKKISLHAFPRQLDGMEREDGSLDASLLKSLDKINDFIKKIQIPLGR